VNVSREADREFMGALSVEGPQRSTRLMANVRKDSPASGIDESQALINFILGLPTAGFHFTIVAGTGAPLSTEREKADRLLRNGTDHEWVEAIMALANAPKPIHSSPPPAAETISTSAVKPTTKKGGRPKLTRSQKAESQIRRKERVRVNVARFRDVLGNQTTPSQPADYAADTAAIFASV